MKLLSFIFSLGALGYGAYWVDHNNPQLKTKAIEFIQRGEFHTLEARFSVQQIMDLNRKMLLKDERHKFLDPVVKFAPYLFMEVKYSTPENQTGEGVILWDLLTGEMVLNTNHWEKTHGFSDCINAHVESNEFRVIRTLAERGGVLDRESLLRFMQTENDILGGWLDILQRKKLIVHSQGQYRLHLQNPRLSVRPHTLIDDRLVTKTAKSSERLPKRFHLKKIKRMAEAAFGQDFAVRHTLNVYLPIYCISIENPDGSIHTSYWNAISGKSLPFTSLLE
ncbi:MAG: hypothetical protein JSR76_04655 [Verrucomicrobia bacterium]|nr:hypothetical protein [Verrucomicrobiota bacterium]